MTDDKGTHKSAKFRWVLLILFIIALVAVFLLIYREPVRAQELNAIAQKKVDASIEFLRAAGVKSEAKIVGMMSNLPEVAKLANSEGEPVIFFDGKEAHILTLAQIAASSDNPAKVLADIKRKIQSQIQDLQPRSTLVVEYYLPDATAHVLLSSDATHSAGVFSDMSRLLSAAHPANEVSIKPDGFRSACRFRELTKNIFGNTAESVQICTETQCARTVPRDCRIYAKDTHAWLFGAVSFDPDTLPEPGYSYGKFCKGEGYYKWSVAFDGLKIFGYDASIPGLGQSGSGTISSETSCGN